MLYFLAKRSVNLLYLASFLYFDSVIQSLSVNSNKFFSISRDDSIRIDII